MAREHPDRVLSTLKKVLLRTYQAQAAAFAAAGGPTAATDAFENRLLVAKPSA